jgi:hypothetical protein
MNGGRRRRAQRQARQARVPLVQQLAARLPRPIHAIASDLFFTFAVSLAAAVVALALNEDIEKLVYHLHSMRLPAALPVPASIASGPCTRDSSQPCSSVMCGRTAVLPSGTCQVAYSGAWGTTSIERAHIASPAAPPPARLLATTLDASARGRSLVPAGER